jgi:hypothetical protein
MSLTDFLLPITAGNILTDLFYSLSPLYYLSKVKVSVYNRWALRGVFMIGLLATVCAIAKCTELPALGKTTNPTCKYERSELRACEHRNSSVASSPTRQPKPATSPSTILTILPYPHRRRNPPHNLGPRRAQRRPSRRRHPAPQIPLRKHPAQRLRSPLTAPPKHQRRGVSYKNHRRDVAPLPSSRSGGR